MSQLSNQQGVLQQKNKNFLSSHKVASNLCTDSQQTPRNLPSTKYYVVKLKLQYGVTKSYPCTINKQKKYSITRQNQQNQSNVWNYKRQYQRLQNIIYGGVEEQCLWIHKNFGLVKTVASSLFGKKKPQFMNELLGFFQPLRNQAREGLKFENHPDFNLEANLCRELFFF
eukprot:TRINITY_DN61_c0_g7_i2.p1 TRINITY_DN61_c0_g7~~TRINITY_DN61_c0_g7_i2.p1  ORF type:complete len:170 (-),score=4.04 TRINITY_DN61_c0_g7_i2:450-959(-)